MDTAGIWPFHLAEGGGRALVLAATTAAVKSKEAKKKQVFWGRRRVREGVSISRGKSGHSDWIIRLLALLEPVAVSDLTPSALGRRCKEKRRRGGVPANQLSDVGSSFDLFTVKSTSFRLLVGCPPPLRTGRRTFSVADN